MLDAVRICGRWVSEHVLARLSARSRTVDPPSRWTLVKDFCRATHWHNAKGDLCLSSANVALKRLEARGLVSLPPPLPRSSKPRRRRQLFDDGKPLPPVPSLPVSVERIQGLRVELLSGPDDPRYPLWNRLVRREHPLAEAPLFGPQLRYLIVCDQGSGEAYLGAFGFGPAAFHLDCRDRWIGWSAAARRANLAQVIGLARFLIRPGVHCRNFASRSYRLVLARVARDWEERQGIRPVLVETFVDRSTQTGVSLSAANWRRLGQTHGPGRSQPSAEGVPQRPKDVWVYELRSPARAGLQDAPLPVVAPRSIFHGFAANASWAEQELDGLDLHHRRLESRFVRMLAARGERPERSFGASFGDAGAAKAAYRFLNNPQAALGFQSLLAPHQHQTHRRMAAESLVILAQDTTTLSYNTLHQTRGLGPIGNRDKEGHGLLLHTLQAFRADRIPLGCAWARVWARPPESDTARRNEQSVAEKESGRWLEAYQVSIGLARAMPQSQLIVCGDREADLFELFDQTEVAPPNLHLLVRAKHDRGLESGGKLWDELAARPGGVTLVVTLPRGANRPARNATLELRWSALELTPPRVALKKSWTPITLHGVMARELNPPAGAEPIEWVLLSDWKIDSAKLAARMIQWYGLRWGIECWHQVLKDSCGVERRQFKSSLALERALVLDMIVAWRARLLCRLAKTEPHLPATLHYTAEELAVLEVYRGKLPRWALAAAGPPATPSQSDGPAAFRPAVPEPEPGGPPPGPAPAEALVPSAPPALTLLQANLLVAMFAGFWGRKGDGHPGPMVVGRGLSILSELVGFLRLSGISTAPGPGLRGEPTRKPG